MKDLRQTIGDKSYERNLEQISIYWGEQAKWIDSKYKAEGNIVQNYIYLLLVAVLVKSRPALSNRNIM